ASGYEIGAPVAVAVLALLALGLEHEGIGLMPGVEVSVASLVCVFAAVVFGPLAAVVVGAAGLLADLPRRDVEQPVLRWATWTASRILVAGAAGLSAVAVLHLAGSSFLGLSAAVTAAVVVEAVVDLALASVTPVVRGTASLTATIRAVGPAFAVSVPLHAPMVAVLVYAYTSVSPWSVALFAAPAIAAQRLLLLYRRQR